MKQLSFILNGDLYFIVFLRCLELPKIAVKIASSSHHLVYVGMYKCPRNVST